ncbi:MAG: Os1348 family NHLP clan protein [Rhodoferax sp.]
MNHETLGRLMDRWNSDAAFRGAVREDPLAALAGMGLQLSDEEKAAMLSVDWTLPDQELVTRASLL